LDATARWKRSSPRRRWMKPHAARGAVSKPVSADLDAWKQDAITGLGEPTMPRPRRRSGPAPHQGVGADLNRKDKALAETAACSCCQKNSRRSSRGRGRMTAWKIARPWLARSSRPDGRARWRKSALWLGSTRAPFRAGGRRWPDTWDRRPDAVRPASSHA